MPIPVAPYTLTCLHCGWKKTITPVGDVIFPGQMPVDCPQCHQKACIGKTPSSRPATWLAKLRNQLAPLGRKP